MSRRLFRTRRAGGPSRAKAIAIAAALAVAVWLLGYLRFIYTLPEVPDALEKAQGIVALTGGAERIVVAIHLLNADKGDRLLISGVHANTTTEDLKKLVDDPGARFSCCVDIDRAARNTVGNAIETARWAQRNGYGSLIVVTARYHMPRSLLELHHAMPNVTLTPYPVLGGKTRVEDWWRSPSMAKVLAAEYTKCLVAHLRLLIAGWLDAREA